MKMHHLSVVVITLLVGVSQAVPLPLWLSSNSRQLVPHDRLDAVERFRVLQPWPQHTNDDDDDVTDWQRNRRSEPPDWLGTHAAGTAWDAYVRMLRQQELDRSEQPRRTVNPVNFLGKRAVFFK